MFNLENAIKKWLKRFRKHRAFNHGSVREMELHLRDHIDDLLGDGSTEQEAFELAVAEFGEIPNMAKEEFWNQKKKTTLISLTHTTMFNNYFKTLLRSLLKNPMSSFINIFGLSVAIGICLVVYTFLAWDQSIDRFHENKFEVYLATVFLDRDGVEQQNGLTPRPLGEMLREDFAQIKKVCRVEDNNVVMKYEQKVFHERVRYVDPEFLEMFTFPLKWGVSSTLADLNSIILSEEMSIKYFGEENPIGQGLLMIFGENNSKAFTVTGVAETFPKARAIDFDFLINFENLQVADPNYDFSDWSSSINATLIQVDNPSDLKVIEQGMEKYKTLQNEVQEDWAISSFAFEQLAGLHFKSGNIRDDISQDGNLEGRIGLPIVAIFMLLLACFNYINIAIVSAAKRLKEIGVRKVIGANRGQIIIQFLAENIFVTFFALVLGFILGVSIFIPWFIQLSGWDLELKLTDMNLWIFLASIMLFTGIASGIYPAFYISKFDITKILKGSVQFGKKNPLTKIFLGIQLILACITITGGVVFTQNTTYQAARSWGYAQEEVLYVRIPNEFAFEQLSTKMMQDPNVLSISGSSHHLGKDEKSVVIHMPDRQYEVGQLSVDAHYIETMGLQIIAGRAFKEDKANDKHAVIVNELLVKNITLENPIGHTFEIDSTRYEVIGVVKDFHSYNFFNEIQPTILKVADRDQFQYLSMRVKRGTEKKTYKKLQEQWSALFPEVPFQGGYQDDVWGGYFEQIATAERFNKVIAFIAVLLASLGLYGLVTLNVSGRVREFSIRKTLGAGIKNITSVIVKQYVLLTVVSMLVGAPISYVFIKAYLKMLFVYHMPMSYSGVAISIVILIFVLLAVISTQILRVAKSNPVDGLKVE